MFFSDVYINEDIITHLGIRLYILEDIPYFLSRIIMINDEDHSKLLQILLDAVYLIVHFKCCKTVHYKKHMVDGIYYNLLIAMITH